MKKFQKLTVRGRFGAAITEYIVKVGTIAFAAVMAFAQFGDVVRFQGGQMALQLAGLEGNQNGWSGTDNPPSRSPFDYGDNGSEDDSGGNTGGDNGGNPGGGSDDDNDNGGGDPDPGDDGSGPGDDDLFGDDGSGGDGELSALPGSEPPQFAFAGNPINLVNGNKFQKEIDYQGINRAPQGYWGLQWVRYYNSINPSHTDLGRGWRHHYQRALSFNDDLTQVTVHKADGQRTYFTQAPTGDWVSRSHDIHQFKTVHNRSDEHIGYSYARADGITEYYNRDGQLSVIKH